MKKISLALEGGGVRGSYQVGAYFAFRKCHYKIIAISGTSIGSFNGAMLASHQEKELLSFWQNLDVSKILEIDELFQKDTKLLTKLKTIISVIYEKLENKGFNIDPLRKILEKELDKDALYRSSIDYGLVTVKNDDKKYIPIEKFKNDIPKDKLIDYILASCFLPIFKKEKLIDNNYYLDGGFHDVCPITMLANKGYKNIYAVRIKGPGIFKDIKDLDANVKFIIPNKDLGSILALDSKLINENISLGYYDTLKVLKNLDGNDYYFKKKSDRYYKRIIRNVDEKILNKAIIFFRTNDPKEIVIRAIEYILKKEKQEVWTIYNPSVKIKEIKKSSNDSFVYKFIKKLKRH